MEDIFDTLINAHPGCAEHGLQGRQYSLESLSEAVDRHLRAGVFSLHGSVSTVSGLEVRALKCGRGSTKVLAWSQMHGNEPVSTQALMDVMNFLEQGSPVARRILGSLSIVCIPLLNPEGHISGCRRNSQGIDINRDAVDLASPEAEFLDRAQREMAPDYALNLHDQDLYHITMPSRKQTLVALLAPECDSAGSVTTARQKAMQAAGYAAYCLCRSQMAEGRVARYQDTFTPTAFGDTFMSRGTASVLIEAGSAPLDPERAAARKAVFASIIMALYAMCGNLGGKACLDAYGSLPLNIYNTSFDLLVHGLAVEAPGRSYKMDIGIRRVKPSCSDEDFTDGTCDFRIVNAGNLDAFAGIVDFDAGGYSLCGAYSLIKIGAKADFAISNGSSAFNIKQLLKNII